MLEARLFGGFDLQLDGRPVLIPSRPAQTLLAYLLLNKQTAHRREKLAGLIWPDNTDAMARRNLRQALWYTRKALDTQDPGRVEYISTDEIWVGFNAQADYWLDVDALGTGQPEECPTPDLRVMVSAYRGDLLPGFYEDWVLLERERLNAQFDRTMQVLLARLLAEQRWTDTLSWAERWIATGHVPEEAYRALMIAHSNLGDRAAVATVFQRCRSALASEVGVEPSQQTLELFATLGQGSLREGWAVAGLTPGAAAETRPQAARPQAEADEAPAPGEPPFKGLLYFDEADADLFFGREQAVARLVARLRAGHPATVVAGASGSGKSSLLRAGLIPALRQATLLIDGSHPPAGSGSWPIFVLTPTAHPLEVLAATLTSTADSVLTTATLVDDLARDARSLHLAARRIVAEKGLPRDGRVLLVVDQFEELFTLCQSEVERRAFLGNLFAAASGPGETSASPDLASRLVGRPLAVVIALRADFYAHCAHYEDLRVALETSQQYIGSMSAAELRRAIEEPARRGRWTFEPGLVDLILRDTGDEPGMLPLLSHSLRETWERRRGRHLTLSGYVEANALVQSGASGEVPALLALRSLRAGYSPQADAALSHGFTRLRLAGHAEGVTAASFSPAGHYILTASADGTVRLSDPSTGREVWLNRNYYPLTAASFDRDGRRVIAGSQDGKVHVWATETGALAGEFQAHDGAVTGLSISPDGSRLLTAGEDGTARIWDPDAGREVQRLAGHDGVVASATFSPDGKLALIGGWDGTGRLYEAATGRTVQRYVGHSAGVLSGAFSPDGKLIATGSDDKTIRLWETETGKVVRVLAGHSDGIYRVLFTPDGSHLLSFSRDGTARLWNVDLRTTVRLACGQLFRDLSEQERDQYGVVDTQPTCDGK